ncbi:MBOAT family O-acyltransferase [Psychrosphaera aquimarina]|uniref:MBOAT family O-acyltransferase n=1 Tax=Psychrosphaera aquimarina TaxID=2044854 RepID=A0ABU3R033_9GAMM|nr:MBOAT family O-acyltransferase [Psychrosphaera aquimarina]MDU0113053.1 MBOAT family O-acyltransferase [Psychrosphaera aquimarina]
MHSTLSLSQYVKKRNGVPLGASHSMRNMLARSFGAKSFPVFWRYWNPIWSYYLSRNVMRPLTNFLPISIATLITFLVSGALHDIAVSIVKWKTVVFFTPWFGIMGLMVIASQKAGILYGHLAWPIRASINASFIFVSLGVTYYVESMYA